MPLVAYSGVQGLGTSNCKTELCTRYILANSSIDRRAQPQVAVERYAVLDFRRPLVNPHLQSDAPRPCISYSFPLRFLVSNYVHRAVRVTRLGLLSFPSVAEAEADKFLLRI